MVFGFLLFWVSPNLNPTLRTFSTCIFSLEGLSSHQSKGLLLSYRDHVGRSADATQTAFRRHQSGSNQAVK